MSGGDEFEVEVVYALPEEVFSRTLTVKAGSTILDAVRRAGVFKRHPEVKPEDDCFGIYGEVLPADTPVYAGARVEVYRPLELTPVESRRRRQARLEG